MPGSAVSIQAAIFAIVDVETTGLERDARVIEVACVRLQGFHEIGRLQSLVRPGISIPPKVRLGEAAIPRRRSGQA